MCGIVGAVAQRDVAPILIEGLRRLEYRGYDSAGLAVLDAAGCITRHRTEGKVARLAGIVEEHPLGGGTGIAHTRWATHGAPSTRNAHPHVCRDTVAVVHNGIIENFAELREQQSAAGHRFTSDTDTEVIVHAVFDRIEAGGDLLEAVRGATASFDGAYALGVVSRNEPDRLVAARRGSPLVIGLGIGENFVASDVYALLPVTQRFMFLEEGDIADVRRDSIVVYDASGTRVERAVRTSELSPEAAERGGYRHYMLKEIHEQPRAIIDTLEGRLVGDGVSPEVFGANSQSILAGVRAVQIVACGTSYHAGLVARYWLESLVGIPCNVEVASEYRYRPHVVAPDTLFVTVSQSGETADTLAALRLAKTLGYRASLTICNVPESSLTRESDLVALTRAGPEIGVASTKAFTTQLTVLALLVALLGRETANGADIETAVVRQLRALPLLCERALELDPAIELLAQHLADKSHALYLGRGAHYPIAMEGALKLKEISYIHAEAYPAGELKHGPLALIDRNMPVVAVLPDDDLLDKLKSNLHEVRARDGQLFVFADEDAAFEEDAGVELIRVGHSSGVAAPIVATIPLQLLAYHVAIVKGTDVDQPRNLAKSVTVE